MRNFRIEPNPSRKLYSDKVVYYVKDTKENKLVAKFDTDNLSLENIDGWKHYTAEQKLELSNYVANIRFVIDKLQLAANLNKDYRLLLPEPLQQALVAIYDKALKHNIVFDPMTAMLNGLHNHIATTEKRLSAHGETSIMSQFNINIENENKSILEKEIRKYTKKIFKRLYALKNGVESYVTVARQLYNKETNLNPTTLSSYIEGKTKPAKWSVSCAITVLGQQNEFIADIMPLDIAIKLWLTPLRYTGVITSNQQAISLFKATFDFGEIKQKEMIALIEQEMKIKL